MTLADLQARGTRRRSRGRSPAPMAASRVTLVDVAAMAPTGCGAGDAWTRRAFSAPRRRGGRRAPRVAIPARGSLLYWKGDDATRPRRRRGRRPDPRAGGSACERPVLEWTDGGWVACCAQAPRAPAAPAGEPRAARRQEDEHLSMSRCPPSSGERRRRPGAVERARGGQRTRQTPFEAEAVAPARASTPWEVPAETDARLQRMKTRPVAPRDAGRPDGCASVGEGDGSNGQPLGQVSRASRSSAPGPCTKQSRVGRAVRVSGPRPLRMRTTFVSMSRIRTGTRLTRRASSSRSRWLRQTLKPLSPSSRSRRPGSRTHRCGPAPGGRRIDVDDVERPPRWCATAEGAARGRIVLLLLLLLAASPRRRLLDALAPARW